jgi:hypothetical protein
LLAGLVPTYVAGLVEIWTYDGRSIHSGPYLLLVLGELPNFPEIYEVHPRLAFASGPEVSSTWFSTRDQLCEEYKVAL